MGAGFGTGGVEGMADGHRPPLSRSLPGGKNPVSVLMEYSQRSGNPIEFNMTGQAGPPHDPRYPLLLVNRSCQMFCSRTPLSSVTLSVSFLSGGCCFLPRGTVEKLFVFSVASALQSADCLSLVTTSLSAETQSEVVSLTIMIAHTENLSWRHMKILRDKRKEPD